MAAAHAPGAGAAGEVRVRRRGPALRHVARLDDLGGLHHLRQLHPRQRAVPERARAQLQPGGRQHPDAGRPRRAARAHPPRDRRPRRVHSARRAGRLPRGRGSQAPHGQRQRHRRRHERRRSVHRTDRRRGAPDRGGVRLQGILLIWEFGHLEIWKFGDLVKIATVHGREILDSRGDSTVEVDVTLEGGVMGRAAVPSGASTGVREALELRDGDTRRYGGKGVRKAVANVNGEIAAALTGKAADQRAVDGAMIALDGTPNKGRLGANALLGVSMAVARASAIAAGVPLYTHLARLYEQRDGATASILPVPMMNILNGGAHADSSVDFQEFMVVPLGAASFADGLRTGAEIFHALRGILKKKGYATGVGDEGGFAPSLKSNREAVDVVLEAVAQAGYTAGENVFLALDVAASELWVDEDKRYELKKSGEQARSADAMVRLYEDWVRQYPIISIEDGLAEGDWDGWKALTSALGGRIQIGGGDE